LLWVLRVCGPFGFGSNLTNDRRLPVFEFQSQVTPQNGAVEPTVSESSFTGDLLSLYASPSWDLIVIYAGRELCSTRQTETKNWKLS
jgi:hypothetical protein